MPVRRIVAGRNFVMRRDWFSTLSAALCVAASLTYPAVASPVGSPNTAAASKSETSWTDSLKFDSLKFWKKDEPATTTPWAATANRAEAAKPTDTISPWRHPIQYFSAAMSETPVADAIRKDKATLAAAQPKDNISLGTPISPATPQFFIALAQASERQGNIVQARAQIQQGMNKWPKDVEILRAAARMEDRQNQLQVAETLYRRACTADPQNAGAINDLGLCLARQGQFDQSVQSFEQAIQLQPDKALYRNNAATVLVQMRQDQRALAHLSAVHGPAVANYNIGKLLVDRGRPHESIIYFQTAAQLDPTMEAAHLAIAQIQGVPVQGPTSTPQFAERVIMPQPATTPTTGPQFAPQQPVEEPVFPTTARAPAIGTSSYVPPTNYYPTTTAPSTPLYQTATSPRYLPPVQAAAPNGTVVR
jgi:Flp pilus assembly protein TadD